MSTLRTAAAACVAAGDFRAARVALASAVLEKPSTTTCHIVADVLDTVNPVQAGLTPVRVAILTNYTPDALVPLLKARALPSGLHVTTYVPGFDTWMQELLDEGSHLRAFDPEVVFLDLLAERIVPDLTHRFLALDGDGVASAVDAMASVIGDAASALRRWSTARMVTQLVPRPFGPTLGLLDHGERSQRAAIDRLNQRIIAAGAVAACQHIDTDRLVAEVGAAGWRDHRLWAMAKIPYGSPAMHRIADEYVRCLRALTGRVRKVLVLDLDDTLWGGVLGERGEHGLDLGPTHPGSGFVEFQEAIADLQRRGVMLAINSSNDADHALSVIDQHPSMVLRREHFVAHRINWHDKADNLVELAGELNVGLDSMVFIDNSEAECARIREALPEVLTQRLTGDPASYGPWLRQSGWFDSLGFNDEDRRRTELYRSEERRARHRGAVASLEDYLVSLGMVLGVETVGSNTIARAADLTQRTNQFNMTTRRRTAAELSAMTGESSQAYVFTLTDRFGSQGVIAFAALQRVSSTCMLISDLLVSCRVLKRNVETAIASVLVELARAAGARTIAGEFRPTARNQAFATFYDTHGFVHADGGVAGVTAPDGARLYVRGLDTQMIPPAHIEVRQGITSPLP